MGLHRGFADAELVGDLLVLVAVHHQGQHTPLLWREMGGALGIFVAYAGTRLILHLTIDNPHSYVPISALPSVPVLLFTLGISVVTGIVFGIAPAWVTSHADPADALRGANRAVGGGGSWAQKSLVIAQTTVSLVLLSAAALLGQSLRNLERQDFGFETQGRYLAWINPSLGNYKLEQMETLFRQIEDRLRQIPGVRMVTSALYAPMSGDSWNNGIRIEGRPEPPPKEDTGSGFARVTPNFFDTIGAKIVLGRPITEEDTASTRHVAVINEAFAKKFFKDQNPIGHHFGPSRIRYSAMYEIVGVAKDGKYRLLGEPPTEYLFLPHSQNYVGKMTLIARTSGEPGNLGEAIRQEVANLDSQLPVYGVKAMPAFLDRLLSGPKSIAALASAFGLVALLVASVGLYGVMSYAVAQRSREVGIRMALGATTGDVLRLVLKEGLILIGAGVGIGLFAAVGATSLLSSFLYGVSRTDAATFVALPLILAAVALVASYLPARRAARVDPMVALRYE